MKKGLKLKHQLYFLVLLTLGMFSLYSLLYYFSFSRIIYRRAETTAEQMIEQVAQNVINMTESIENSAEGLSYNRYIQEILISEDRAKNIELYDYVRQIVSATKASNNNIYAVTWISDAFRKISDPVRDENGTLQKLYEIYNFTSDEFRKPVFSSIIQGDNNSLYYFGYVYPIFSLSSGSYSKIGSGIFVLDIRELGKLVKINNITENSLFTILDQNNNVVVSNRGLKTGDVYQDIFWNEEEQEIVKSDVNYNNMKSIAQCMKIEKNGWKIVSIIPIEELSSDIHEVVEAGFVLALISFLLLLLFSHIIIRSITKPINKIANFLNQTETNTLKERMDIPLQHEVASIASNINIMLERVEQMTHKIVENQTLLYEAKLTEQNAELLALQSQINPHFLYNTLETINWMAFDLTKSDNKVSKAVNSLAQLFRNNVYLGDYIIPIEQEIANTKNYLDILKLRYVDLFDVIWEVDESIMQYSIIKICLQPIIENAVYHGLKPKGANGVIKIKGEIYNDKDIWFSISDNGVGMNPMKLAELNKQDGDNQMEDHIGIYNVNQRINIVFGMEYGVVIESVENLGTLVRIKLPIINLQN